MQSQELVNVIFTKLSMVYGRDFLSRWEGLDLNDVKADWAHELSGFSAESVKYALQNLPEKSPTVLDFRRIALRTPTPVTVRLEQPKANPEIARESLRKARELVTKKL